MISDIYLYTIYFVVHGLMYPFYIWIGSPVYLADVSLDSAISGAISTATTYLASISFILPIPTMLLILGLEIGIEIGIFTYKVIMWVVKRFPTQS